MLSRKVRQKRKERKMIITSKLDTVLEDSTQSFFRYIEKDGETVGYEKVEYAAFRDKDVLAKNWQKLCATANKEALYAEELEPHVIKDFPGFIEPDFAGNAEVIPPGEVYDNQGNRNESDTCWLQISALQTAGDLKNNPDKELKENNDTIRALESYVTDFIFDHHPDLNVFVLDTGLSEKELRKRQEEIYEWKKQSNNILAAKQLLALIVNSDFPVWALNSDYSYSELVRFYNDYYFLIRENKDFKIYYFATLEEENSQIFNKAIDSLEAIVKEAHISQLYTLARKNLRYWSDTYEEELAKKNNLSKDKDNHWPVYSKVKESVENISIAAKTIIACEKVSATIDNILEFDKETKSLLADNDEINVFADRIKSQHEIIDSNKQEIVKLLGIGVDGKRHYLEDFDKEVRQKVEKSKKLTERAYNLLKFISALGLNL